MKFATAVLLGAIAFSDVNAIKVQDVTTPAAHNLVQSNTSMQICLDTDVEAQGWGKNLPGFYSNTAVVEIDGEQAATKFTGKSFAKPTLMVAYHPQCPHCKTIVNDVTALATDINMNKVNAEVDAINMSKMNPKQSQGIAVNSYPTIRLYKQDGSHEEYKGERTEAGYMEFLASQGVTISALVQKTKK